MSKKTLYLFDFDGTITKNDTYVDFFLRSFGAWFLIKKIIFNFLKVIGLYLKKDKSDLKEFLTFLFLKDKNQTELHTMAQNYFKENQNRILYKSALQKIKSIQFEKDSTIFIVSASLDLWLMHFSQHLKTDLICTELAFENEKYKGFKTKNCNGKEKVNRIQKEIKLSNFDSIIAYGNSKGDKEMFKLAHHHYYQFFKE